MTIVLSFCWIPSTQDVKPLLTKFCKTTEDAHIMMEKAGLKIIKNKSFIETQKYFERD